VTGRADERSFEPGAYESLSWDHVDDVVAAISAQGFDHQSSCLFDYPWPGKHVRFTMATANSPASGESKAVAALPHV
jgi:hypothetical protein